MLKIQNNLSKHAKTFLVLKYIKHAKYKTCYNKAHAENLLQAIV